MPKGHQGLDLQAVPGTPILAVANGRILVGAPITGAYGRTLMLVVGINDLPEMQVEALKAKYPNDNKVAFFYAHLSEISVPDGAIVHAGDIIGKTGCSGNAHGMTTIRGGAHLHFEVRKANANYPRNLNNRIDPLPFIKNCTNPHPTPDRGD